MFAEVKQQINIVRSGSGRSPVNPMLPEHRLRHDLEFDSLDLAELSVRLEAEFGVDVFSNGIPTTVEELVVRLGLLGVWEDRSGEGD